MFAELAARSGRVIGLAGVGAILLAGSGIAHGDLGEHGPNAGEARPVVTFDAIAGAESTLSLRLEQVRSVLETHGGTQSWAGIRERLSISPDPVSGEHRFDLEFLGLVSERGVGTVQGSGLGSGLGTTNSLSEAARRELYRGYAGYLHLHANFRIDDPVLAAQNYVIVELGHRVRLGRPTCRVALMPRRLGRNPWVLEIDAATSYPLFRAEFNVAGVLVSTLEVTRFEETTPATTSGCNWWQPVRRIDEYATVQDALATLPTGVAPTLPTTRDLPLGYELAAVRMVHETLRPESSLVLTYSDGIDRIFVVSTIGAPPPSLPVASGTGGSGSSYAILVYQDQNVAQFLFYADSVTTMVIGRAGQFALGGLAHDLLSRAIRG